jgi:hypothetical protein
MGGLVGVGVHARSCIGMAPVFISQDTIRSHRIPVSRLATLERIGSDRGRVHGEQEQVGGGTGTNVQALFYWPQAVVRRYMWTLD